MIMKKLLFSFLMIILAVSLNAQKINNAFFTRTSYIGAFDGTNDWTSGWANFDPINTTYPATTTTKGNGNFTLATGLHITANETWSGNVKLDGWVYVDNGATLTINAGTTIRGTASSALIIQRGGKIMAEGTSSSPIVFTSNLLEGTRGPSNWAGIIICGKGVNNIAGGEGTTEGGTGALHGGTDNADNSGTMKYVRIEFPGFDVTGTGNEINGLSLYSVGSGTVLDYIQVSYSGDDSYEWFGGAVNAKHLIAFRTEDDDFDTDNGYVGMVQFGLISRINAIHESNDACNGFESDNDSNGTDALPKTAATFSNISGFGPSITNTDPAALDANHQSGNAFKLRRATNLQIYNSVMAGWANGIYIESASSWNAAATDMLTIQNTIIAGSRVGLVKMGSSGPANATEVSGWFKSAARHNTEITLSADAQITAPFTYTALNFQPAVGSPALTKSFWLTTPVLNKMVKSVNLNCYPNPFTASTRIDLNIETKSNVRASVYDITGKLVKELYNGQMQAGVNTIEFDGSELSKGIYFGKIAVGNQNYTLKMILK